MKATHAIGIGVTFGMIAVGGWVGCSSSSSTPTSPGDGGSSSSSSSSGAASSSSSSSSGGATDAAPSALTWTQVYTDVISPYCADCHGRAPAPDGGLRGGIRVGKLDMSSVDAGWASLINIAAQGVGSPAALDASFCDTLEAGAKGSIRVVPGDAGQSLLCLKVHGFDVPPPCGAPMPEPTPGPGEILDGGQDAAFVEVRDWINQGALP
jgi:hypothetical protein